MVERIVIRDEKDFVKYTLLKYKDGSVNIVINRYIAGKDEIYLPKECVELLKRSL